MSMMKIRATYSGEEGGVTGSEPVSSPTIRTLPTPLTPEQVRGVEAVGQRLRAELGRLYRWLPAEARSVRTMAAYFGVDRNTCQRVVAAVHPGATGCETVVRLPGIKSLEQLAKRAKAKGAPREMVSALSAAISRLTGMLEEFDESQARLKSRLEATVASGARADRNELEVRRSIHEDMAHLIGRRLRAYSLITAVGPHPDDATKVEQAWVRGLIGMRSRADAPPFALGSASTDPKHGVPGQGATMDPLARRTAPGERATGLVTSLSSSPAPTLTNREREGLMITVLDPATLGESSETDAVVAVRLSHVEHPRLKAPEVFHTSAVMQTPAMRLVFDVYFHRSLALASVPSAGAFQYTMSFSDDPEQNWPFRVPGIYRQELLGTGLRNSGHEAWDRHGDAAAHLFEQTGWRADEYVGHRLDVAYPMWGSTFYQWFDFRAKPVDGV
jgi:hypothetical protein